MLNDLITITPRHENAAKMIFNRILELRNQNSKEKLIISISGEVGTGKSTVSTALGLMLKKIDIRSKIMDLDDYYKNSPLERKKWRLENGITSIGYDEYDWGKVITNINDFMESKVSVMPCVDLITRYIDELKTNFQGVDVLIINGLYSLKIDMADLKVFIEMTYGETGDAQKYNQKEEFDEYRKTVMQREHEVVQSLKPNAEFFIDFDQSLFHL